MCRMSTWPRMYLFVLMAITTDARKGELPALRYADLYMERATAHVRQAKSDEERVLPLTPAVIAEIKRCPLIARFARRNSR